MALHKLGWKLTGPAQITTDAGEVLDLMQGSPACFKYLIRRRYTQLLTQRAAEHYGLEHKVDFLPYRRVLAKLEGW